jgi:hypothetical protein
MGVCFSEQASKESVSSTTPVESKRENVIESTTITGNKEVTDTSHEGAEKDKKDAPHPVHKRIKIVKDAPGAHLGSHTLHESEKYTVTYPDHPPRTDTPLYRKTHKELCLKRDLPCFTCGKTRAENPGLETETHHFYCEKAMENAIDWKKFGKLAQTLYNPQTGLHLGSAYNWEEVAKNPDLFVDSEGNMIVLCPEHHRSSNKGIHHTPFPEWFVQCCILEGFVVLS